MKLKDLTLEEVAKILDIDHKNEDGCGQNGICNSSCPLWCEANSQICSTLTDPIEECKKYFDMDITYNRTLPDNKKYYVINKIFLTPKGNIIRKFVCIVNDKLIAKDFCNKHPGYEYKEETVEEERK